MNTSKPTLIFVYNADSGLFNTVTDIAHKIFSPKTYSCNLCAITHSYFSEQKEWRAFINELDYPMVFLHRDEFTQQYPDISMDFPAILLKTETGLSPWIDTSAINACDSIDSLKSLIRDSLKKNSV